MAAGLGDLVDGLLAGDEPEELETEQEEEPVDLDVEKAEFLQLLQEADDYREPFRLRQVENRKIYAGWRAMADDETQEEHDTGTKTSGRSNLHNPKPYQQVDTLRAAILDSIFSARPIIDFLPKPSQQLDPEAMKVTENKAALAAAEVDNQLQDAGAYAKFYEWVTNWLVEPAGIMALGWRREEKLVKTKKPVMMAIPPKNPIQALLQAVRITPPDLVESGNYETVEEQQITYDGNELSVIDFEDFWPDPRAKWYVKEWRYCIIRRYMTREEIEDERDFLEAREEGKVLDINYEDLPKESTEDDSLETEVGIDTSREEAKKAHHLYEVYYLWQPDQLQIWVEKAQALYIGPNPFWHQQIPVLFMVYDIETGRGPYQTGAIGLITELAHEKNTQRNQMVDLISRALNRMTKARRGANLSEADLIARSNGIVWVDDPSDVEWENPIDVPAGAFGMDARTDQDMEATLATNPVAMGASEKTGTTATEIIQKGAGTGRRYKAKVILFVTLGLDRLAFMMDKNNQQLIDETRLVKYWNQQGVMEWRKVDVGDRQGEHDYRPGASAIDPSANREVRKAQAMQLYEAFTRSQNPYAKLRELTQELVELHDFPLPEKFVKSDDEVKQDQAQQQAAQQAQMQLAQQQQAMQAQAEAAKQQMEQMKLLLEAVTKLFDLFQRGDLAREAMEAREQSQAQPGQAPRPGQSPLPEAANQ
jgi:hypothetical protein